MSFEITNREDRIGRYFKKYLSRFVFTELSPSFIAKSKIGSLWEGVPAPLRQEEVASVTAGGVDFRNIAENISWVMGCDPNFPFTENYCEILKAIYGEDIYRGVLIEGGKAAEKGEMDDACIHYRAALCIKPDYMEAMFAYANACRIMYENSSNEEYIGRFKAESLEWFEMLTVEHPDFPMGYYFLGYTYLNMGLYSKAELTWKTFVELSDSSKELKEIRERLEQIKDPVNIERGCLSVDSGRFLEGINILEPYLDSKFNDWWPLHYNLARAYDIASRLDDAEREYKTVLKLNGSHLDTMRELLKIYYDRGDEANIEKYTQKIEIIQLSSSQEHMESLEDVFAENKKLEEEEPDPIQFDDN